MTLFYFLTFMVLSVFLSELIIGKSVDKKLSLKRYLGFYIFSWLVFTVANFFYKKDIASDFFLEGIPFSYEKDSIVLFSGVLFVSFMETIKDKVGNRMIPIFLTTLLICLFVKNYFLTLFCLELVYILYLMQKKEVSWDVTSGLGTALYYIYFFFLVSELGVLYKQDLLAFKGADFNGISLSEKYSLTLIIACLLRWISCFQKIDFIKKGYVTSLLSIFVIMIQVLEPFSGFLTNMDILGIHLYYYFFIIGCSLVIYRSDKYAHEERLFGLVCLLILTLFLGGLVDLQEFQEAIIFLIILKLSTYLGSLNDSVLRIFKNEFSIYNIYLFFFITLFFLIEFKTAPVLFLFGFISILSYKLFLFENKTEGQLK